MTRLGVILGELLLALHLAVAPVAVVGLPKVVLDRQAQAAELAQDAGAVLHRGEHAGAGVVVPVLHVARAAVLPAAGAVDQAAGVALHRPLDDLDGVVLAPALVEGDPDHDARVVVERGHNAVPLVEPLGGRGGVPLAVLRPAGADALVQRGGHVLPDEQAELVGVVVPAGRLGFGVLAGAVEAHLLRDLDVVLQGVVGGRGVEAVGPPALVERAVEERDLAVELDAGDAGLVLAHLDLAHAEVALHRVGVVAREFDGQVVKVRRVGAPELGVGDLDADLAAAGGGADLLAAVGDGHGHGHGHVAVAALDVGRDDDFAGVDVGGDLQAVDVGGRDGFEPNGLPDAGDGRVPDALGVEVLLAVGLGGAVGGVVDAQRHLVVAESLRASVTSKVKGSKPPLCWPTSVPLT